MPAISAHQSDNAQSVLDTIGRQLTITDEHLVEITKAFVDEFQLGLNNYGKDMAMMCVILFDLYAPRVSSDPSSPTFVPGVPDGSEKGYEHTARAHRRHQFAGF
jgi:hexokinase